MKPIRVMILDDEILAIEHIRRLVPWEELGFEIACVATHPVKALSLAEHFRPQLIIVDIKMPVMDGLEFCKRMLATGHSPKIVLLSSYKEFDYAKEALQLGLSNYWVKHELDAEHLTLELATLKKEFQNDYMKHTVLRKQLLGELLAGRPLSQEQWNAISKHRTDATSLQLVLVQQDRPFPLFPDMTNIGTPFPPSFEQSIIELEDESLLAATPIRKSQYAFLFADQGYRSEQKLWDNMHEKAQQARLAFESQIAGTASVAVAYDIGSWKDVPSLFHEANVLLSRSVFYGPKHLYLLRDRHQYAVTRFAAEKALSVIADRLKTLESETMPELLTSLFSEAADSKDVLGFADMCKQLIALADHRREAIHLPTLEMLWSQGHIDASNWRSWSGIRDWFIEQFRSIADSVSTSKAFSRKVKQVLDYIHKHYSEDIGAQQIAEHIGISRDHLRHLFKEETGQTVLDALTSIRIDHAKRMLDEGKLKIYEIAEFAGYRNSQYFSQVFRKVTGTTPLEYVERTR